MPRNIEIKARVEDMAALRRLTEQIADQGPVLLRQSDTFFNCPRGRLKLRVIDGEAGELIFYRRPDTSGPSQSTYSIFPVADPDALRETLDRAYGTLGLVEKERTLFHAGQTRIHLDRVTGLGDFMELEVVLDEGQAADQGVAVAHDLMARLGILPEHLVDRAYLDLLLDAKSPLADSP
jgi:predicted adenylyl cyclase CyaB